MQPRYLNADLTKSLLRVQPFVRPTVQARTAAVAAAVCAVRQQRPVVVKGSTKVRLFFVCLVICFLVSGIGGEGMASFTRYMRSLKWTPLPLGVGFAIIATTQYRHTRKREERRLAAEGAVCLAQPWEVEAYKLLPLRHFSRLWGWVNNFELPYWCRSTILGSYVRTFGCDMTEAEVEDVMQYSSLSSLFRRSLKPSVRPVCPVSGLTSPVDGTVVQAGPVSCGTLHQIKGVTYSLSSFLGPNVWTRDGPCISVEEDNDTCYHNSCITDPDLNELHQVVLYLAPGDYHRFHSPAEWKVSHRRHFPGELLSVSPSFTSWIPNLFVLNERVAYVGRWKHGFFSMTAVGATNVGSVKAYFDEDLRTNERRRSGSFYDKKFDHLVSKITFNKGDPFGEFNLGSTIVLLFEAPKNSVLRVQPGQKIKMGEAILAPETFTDKAAGPDKDCSHNKGVER
ncbi:Phosphatidylserine decarboxylase eukaryotic type 1 [Trinorchestia longiramus]|nr:Phosphatidylserine decarboxylase eukaryotic type 1 [Trinorchestia longiramus]